MVFFLSVCLSAPQADTSASFSPCYTPNMHSTLRSSTTTKDRDGFAVPPPRPRHSNIPLVVRKGQRETTQITETVRCVCVCVHAECVRMCLAV